MPPKLWFIIHISTGIGLVVSEKHLSELMAGLLSIGKLFSSKNNEKF